ncbi:uncharacterized protein LOC128556130 [Mercenaria mercenaria]|uniref:uncharacterized protein LOC128556130 n=1 Tax=Mercenaria mercenaria TaxID=6596 RepID=UPI00234E7E1F|nr:uncharacterized protein LOC128556130 [Mercenaria mercenaria]
MRKAEKEQRDTETVLREEITDLKCRSMRDNLLFFKLLEEKEENCVQKVLELIENDMKIENAKQEIKLHRAHRVGKYNNTKVRPIVAKFAYFPDRERVKMAAKALAGTPYGVGEQFPKEIVDTRKRLVPIMKKARDEGKDAFIKVDKLYINKQLYREGSENV